MILTLAAERKIPLIVIRRSPDDKVERFCRSLQIVSRRDIDGTVTTVIRTMLQEAPEDSIGSSELASLTNLNRVTVIHHLRRLEKVGVVQKERHKYRLTPQGFSQIVQKMREETEQMFNEAQMLAQRIDEEYFFSPLLRQPVASGANVQSRQVQTAQSAQNFRARQTAGAPSLQVSRQTSMRGGQENEPYPPVPKRPKKRGILQSESVRIRKSR